MGNGQVKTRMILLAGIACSVLVIMHGYYKNSPTTEEKKALAAFQAIQQSLEFRSSFTVFSQLLDQAESQLNLVKQTPKTLPCLVAALDKCLASYHLIDKVFKTKQEAMDEKRRQELDAALNHSTAFSALNIQQAMDCCR